MIRLHLRNMIDIPKHFQGLLLSQVKGALEGLDRFNAPIQAGATTFEYVREGRARRDFQVWQE